MRILPPKRNNYFSLMVAFKLLLSHGDYINYHNGFNSLYNELSEHLKTISTTQIRNIMGLPNNWRKLSALN